MMNFQPFQWTQFHGGITDNFIDTVATRYEYADNFNITENRKIYTRPGSTLWNPTFASPVIPAGNQRINALIDHFGLVLVVSAKKVYWAKGTAWEEIKGDPSTNSVFSVGDVNSIVSVAQWNNITYVTSSDFPIPMKIYTPTGADPRVVNASMPPLASAPTVTAGAAGTNNYIYKFLYAFPYEVQGVNHLDFGPVTTVALNAAQAPDISTVNITAIPVITNGASNNFRTGDIKVHIYRTINNGTIFFKVGEVTNGTTLYNDNTSDTTLANSSLIYTDSDVLEFNPIPLCKTFHITNNLGFVGNIKSSTGELFQNRLYQSTPGIVQAFPDSLFLEIDDNIVAISSVGETPVVLCERSIYRLDGFFNSKGEGFLKAQKIESTVGCIGLSSVVQLQRGIVFASLGGFYFTDGWEVRKLSAAFNTRYNLLTQTAEQKRRIYGTFDRVDKRVAWTVQETGATDCNKLYVLDTRYGLGIVGDDLEDVQVCFTNWGGTYFNPSAILFLNGELIRAENSGYVLVHQKGLQSDPLIDVVVVPSAWEKTPIFWRLRTMATSMSTPLKKKFIPKMVLSAQNVTNASIQITGVNDCTTNGFDLIPLRFRKNCTWGDVTIEWPKDAYAFADDIPPEAIWNYQGMIEETRLFQSSGLRCNYKQIEITNAFVQIFNSGNFVQVLDTFNLGIVDRDGTLKTVTLVGPDPWPLDMVGYYIYFLDDNFVNGFQIIARTPTTLTISDPMSLFTTTTGEFFSIKNYQNGTVNTNILTKTVTLNFTSLYTWPPDMRDYYIYFEEDYDRGYKILSRTDTTLVIDDPRGTLLSFSNSKFIVKGYPKNEILNIVSLSLWYAYLGEPIQYMSSSAGSTPG